MRGLDNELCPFCGGDRIEVIKDPRSQWVNWYVAVCIVGDPCGAIGPARRTKAEAIAAWNTRAALRPPAPDAGDMQGLVERLREVELYPDLIVRNRILEAADEIQSLTAQLAAERAKVAELVEGLAALLKWAENAEVMMDCEGKIRSLYQIEADGDLPKEIASARALIERMTVP